MVQPMGEDEPAAPKLSREEFEVWKASQEAATILVAKREAAAQREADLKAGKIPLDEMTGRELAEYNPEVFDGY